MMRSIKNAVNSLIGSISRGLPVWEGEAIQIIPSLKSHSYLLPANATQLSPDIAAQYRQKTANAPANVPALHIFTIRNANVSRQGAMFKNLRMFKPDMCPYSDVNFRNSFLLKQWITPANKVKHFKEAAVVHDLWSTGNYYHWLIEVLPKLLILEQHMPNVSVIIPHPTPSYVVLTASVFGFKKFITISQDEIIKVDKLIVPEKAPFIEMNLEDVSFNKNPYGLSVVKERILQNICPEIRRPTRRIYVSRRRQAIRHIANESVVELLLSDYGFETVFFEDMSFEEQVRLMQETEILVGLHGANLTNMMFMHPQTKIIEIINQKLDDHLFYFFLSSYFSISYYSLPCHPTDESAAMNSDVEVDLSALKNTLNLAIVA